jgi:anti-anti-sigma factor
MVADNRQRHREADEAGLEQLDWCIGFPHGVQKLVHADRDGSAVTVALAGELDLVAAGPVREALTCAMREARPRLIVDLSELTFIDSSGLHVLLAVHRLCREAGLTLTIRPAPPNVQRVFELTGLVGRLPFEISG